MENDLAAGTGLGRTPARSELIPGDSTVYFGPIMPNAYGPGIHSDAIGRAFQWQPQDWPNMLPDPSLQVTPNQWRTGGHADQYVRRVKPVCPFAREMVLGGYSCYLPTLESTRLFLCFSTHRVISS